MNPKISVLVSARKNSKYLAKFLNGYLRNTLKPDDIELLIMINAQDSWNEDLEDIFTSQKQYNIQFFHEDLRLGRAGLHIYFNTLYKNAKGDWIIYFCEDHYIVTQGWDVQLRELIAGRLAAEAAEGQPPVLQHQNGVLDPAKIWCIVPKFDNAGPMNHMLSRGMIETMGGKLSEHGNLDSYLNDICGRLPRDRRILMDSPLFHDFTHDSPSPMSDAHQQSVISEKGKQMPRYEDPIIGAAVDADVDALRAAIERGL